MAFQLGLMGRDYRNDRKRWALITFETDELRWAKIWLKLQRHNGLDEGGTTWNDMESWGTIEEHDAE